MCTVCTVWHSIKMCKGEDLVTAVSQCCIVSKYGSCWVYRICWEMMKRVCNKDTYWYSIIYMYS